MRYIFGDYCLDTQRYALSQRGQEVKLRPKVFDVLTYLIRHRDRVVSKDELLAEVWPEQFIGDGTLNACVMAVRKALGDSGQTQHYVQTLHGRGYRFVASAEEQAHPLPDSSPGPAPSAAAGRAAALQEQAALVDTTERHAAAVETPGVPPAGPEDSAVHRAGGEQEYKQVTVLCGGLSDAAALAARLGAEAMHDHMQALLTQAQTTVEGYGGSMLQYGVDGFMALFGAPLAQEDHARRAVLAALALQHALDWPRDPAAPALSLALETGAVLVGSLAGESQRPYTAMGDTIHQATALQKAAPAHSILLSQTTYQLVQAEVQADVWEEAAGSALRRPASVYRLQQVLRQRAGVPARQALSQRPFVGRSHELTMLHERLTQAARREGQVVGITGEAGIGKSRLLAEFHRHLHSDQCTWLAAQCLPYSQMTPYFPVLALLRQRCQMRDTDTPETIHAKVEAAVHETQSLAAVDVAVLLQLLDSAEVAAAPAHESLCMSQAQVFALLRQLILSSQSEPLLLVVEDAHWIDASSEAWLASVVAGLARQPVLLLVTYRPGYQPSWLGQSYATQLALPSLAAQESLGVVQTMAPAAALPEPLQRAIVRRAAGNPFFLEELTWAMLEPAGSVRAAPLPETIQAVLAARIDRLPSEAKRLLQLAAVIGLEVAYPLLRALAGMPEAGFCQHLEHLQSAELLTEMATFPTRVYTFKHALLQEVVYHTMHSRTRQHGHRRLAQLLATDFAALAETQPALLAYHYTAAALYPPAIDTWRRAAAQAFQRGAHQEALTHLRHGLALLEQVSEVEARQQQELELLTTLGPLTMVMQGMTAPAVEDVYGRAYALCQQHTEVRHSFAVLRGLHHLHRAQGRLHSAREFAEQLLELARSSQDATLLLEAHMSLGTVLLALGEFVAAHQTLEQGLAYRDAAPFPSLPDIAPPVLGCLIFSGFALWYLGYPEQAQARLQAGLEMAQQLVYPHHLVWGQHLAAIFAWLCRDRQGMRELAQAVLSGAARYGLQICHLTGLILQGLALVYAGQGATGLAQMQQARDACRERGIGASLPLYEVLLAEAYCIMGQSDPGLEAFDEAQSGSNQQAEHAYAAEGWRLRGELLLLQNHASHPGHDAGHSLAEAESSCQQALHLARGQQAKMLELRAAVSLSRLWQQQGKRHAARQLLTEVYAWFSEGFSTVDLQEAHLLLRELQT